MPKCRDCANLQPKDDLEGYCTASENKVVELDRDVEDCIALAFKPKDQNSEDIL